MLESRERHARTRHHRHRHLGGRPEGAPSLLPRPAIDALFRSAARACGPRVAGVVLTGHLDDGTVGLQAIKRRGGLTVVQDPVEAEHPGMPRSALQFVEIGHCALQASLPETTPGIRCRGTSRSNRTSRFRCHVGHSFTGDMFAAEQGRNLENALWSAIRMMEEKVALHRQLAEVTVIRDLVLGGSATKRGIAPSEEKAA